jgi:outer membrane protein OmpU
MKKILFASTILATLGTVAVAETGVSISGYGRFGLQYDSGKDNSDSTKETTTIETRLRLNIDAKTETDTGVTFGGRIRLQYDEDDSTSETSPALLYAAYEGLRVEVGNVNSAIDSVALIWDSEMGLTSSSVGDPVTDDRQQCNRS